MQLAGTRRLPDDQPLPSARGDTRGQSFPGDAAAQRCLYPAFQSSPWPVGHVFQGRYKAIRIDREAYLLELARYMVLNPVRAGRVQAPTDGEWSSYHATAGLATPPPWLYTDWLLYKCKRSRCRTSGWRYRLVAAIVDAYWKRRLNTSPMAASAIPISVSVLGSGTRVASIRA